MRLNSFLPGHWFALLHATNGCELNMIKLHRTCPGDLDEVVKQLELVTDSPDQLLLVRLHWGRIDRLAASATFFDPVIRSLINTFPAKMKYKRKRQLEAWRHGSGLDYEL
ncbi:hypothetical protein NL676_025063 [Syzygium grande]|nr:hypothetical protein NL676_025063 [Syzygium grande]